MRLFISRQQRMIIVFDMPVNILIVYNTSGHEHFLLLLYSFQCLPIPNPDEGEQQNEEQNNDELNPVFGDDVHRYCVLRRGLLVMTNKYIRV
jgi:hypothetical protein